MWQRRLGLVAVRRSPRCDRDGHLCARGEGEEGRNGRCSGQGCSVAASDLPLEEARCQSPKGPLLIALLSHASPCALSSGC